ncbi:DNA-binding transcriptional regulator, IclR family [Nocardiopsis flavescens]|uniref:Glycerol operon regulatory protein n=1 Tax=Nocardiopsis flavescens TaxID=758803 RepID=A0A1M6HBJ5_9ACTN|nr:IclR family transcriptional regulator [Nocardiopsis flavescens]SHJ19571.1 DNA-binding transcriptional regulator, IclR family [Nocardiopsis flavescens]
MEEESRPAGSQAVVRALRVLHCFRDHGPELGATDIARLLDLRTSTAHRLARTLVSEGFLEQDAATSRYRLGAAVAELGRALYRHRGLYRIEPLMESLAEATGTRPGLAIRSGSRAVVIAGEAVDPEAGLSLYIPLHASAMGKVLLAWDPAADPSRLELEPLTAGTITDPDRLRAELERVRARGYAVNDGEFAEHKRTVAVPLVDAVGQVRMALALRADAAELPVERFPELARTAQDFAPAFQRLLLHPAE